MSERVFRNRYTGRWEVWSGEELIGTRYEEERAYALLERHRRQDSSSWRNCLRCRDVFRSEGPHHRMCTTCRKRNREEGRYVIAL